VRVPRERPNHAVTGGFTRRCGVRAPTDKRPCMYMFGHDGRHEWQSERQSGAPDA
jgi:hypothetical protein